MPPLIGLIGHKRVGKDTFAQRLIDTHGYTKIAFADPLRDLVARIDGILAFERDTPADHTSVDYTDDRGWTRVSDALNEWSYEVVKDSYDEYRRLLQETGVGVRDILGEDTWVKAGMSRIAAARASGSPIVVTDVRFPNEAAAIKNAGGILVRITRDTGLTDTHISETALDDHASDYSFANDGSLAWLHGAADGVTRVASEVVAGLHPLPIF